MPQPVGAAKQQRAVAFGIQLPVFVEVRLIDDLEEADARLPPFLHGGGARLVDRAEALGERDMLRVGQRRVMVVGADGVAVHEADDLGQYRVVHLRQVRPGNLGGEQGMHLFRNERHGI